MSNINNIEFGTPYGGSNTTSSSNTNQASSGLSNERFGNALDSTLPTHGQGSGYGTSGSHATSNPAGFADAVGKEGSGAGFGTAQILSGGAHNTASHGQQQQQQQHSTGHSGLTSGAGGAGLAGIGAGLTGAGHQHQHGEHGSHGLHSRGQESSLHAGGSDRLTNSGLSGVTSTGHVAPASNLTKNSNDPITAPSTAGGSQALNPHASEISGHNNSGSYNTSSANTHTGAYAAGGAGLVGAGLAGAGASHGSGTGTGLPYGEKRTEGSGADNRGLPTGAGEGPTAALKDTLGFDPKTSGEQTGVSHELPEPKHVESMSQGPHGLVWQESTKSYVHRRELDGKGSTGVPLRK